MSLKTADIWAVGRLPIRQLGEITLKSIINAAPGVLNHGVKDESGRQFTRAPEDAPQHLPKFFIFAKRGPTSEELIVGDERLRMYGEDTIIERSKRFNHQTAFSNRVNRAGNSAMYVRMVPKDAGPKPSIRLYMDVLNAPVDDYERNIDGSIKTDVAGDPIVKAVINNGYRVKFVVKHFEDEMAAEAFGAGNIEAGTMVDTALGRQSNLYPILDLEHSFYGADGKNTGIRLWSQNLDNTTQLPTKMMSRTKAYPYSFAVVRKSEVTGSASIHETIMGEQQIPVTFKKDVVDPDTLVRLYIGERVKRDYENSTDVRYPIQYGEFGRVHVYQENIDHLLELFHEAESPFIDADSDFTASEEDIHLFNFVSGTSSRNVPYHSFIFVDDSDAVRLSRSTNVYCQGGSDGTMTHEVHAELVREYMARYLDENDELNDVAYHIESHVYDSGFPLETKYSLINFISQRKDTFVVLSPNEFGKEPKTQTEEYSVAAALLDRLRLHPESTHFGTEVFRGLIVGATGVLRGSQLIERLPATYEVAAKSANYMGAGNGQWKNGKNFDGYPGSVIEDLTNLSVRYTPPSVRNRFWDVGLNWIDRMNRVEFHFPALKTVYSDDTSVLTSYITSCAILKLQKLLYKTQKVFSGVSGLTPAQFTQRVNDFYAEEVKGLFDNRFIITPRAHFTSLDQIRNYSWTMPVDNEAPGMQTVMTAYVVAKRRSDSGATV
jgi:hypothetical protein